MPYVDRDGESRIICLYECPQREGHEFQETAELWVDPKAAARALIDRMERERMLPKAVRSTIMQLAEKEAIAAGAARQPPLTAAQSLALLRANTQTVYNQTRLFHEQIDVIRVENGL